MKTPTTRGRCIDKRDDQITIRNEAGNHVVSVSREDREKIKVGDVVELRDGQTIVLTPNRKGSSRWLERTLNPRRVRGLQIRSQVESEIRAFFLARQFHETRTPLLVPCPGMEPHIRPFRVEGANSRAYLPTSPEFAMKRLLVGGLERIFQICPSFRDEPASVTHHPEFTMLEWYRAYADYEEIMGDVESLMETLAIKIHGRPVIRYQGREISVKTSWPRLRVRDLFKEHVGVDLVKSDTAEKLAAECSRLGLDALEKDRTFVANSMG